MPDVLGGIIKGCLQWAGHAWRKEGTIIRIIQSSVLKEKETGGTSKENMERSNKE